MYWTLSANKDPGVPACSFVGCCFLVLCDVLSPPQVLAETSGIPRSLLVPPKPVQEQAGVLPPSDGSDQAVDRAGLSQPKA